jgi:propionyl-CoA carboxylase alpha chain
VGRIPALNRIRKILVANRGEIARRIFRTCDRLGIPTVAVYSDADRDAPHVREACEAVRIGEAPAPDSYLRIDRILEAARRTNADAIHPGYGFLAENADFAQACVDAGLVFLGPRAETIRAMASKIEGRKIAERAGVPVVPCEGFPLLVKAAAGGGGKGMRRVDRAEDLEEARAAAAREAEAAFGDGTLLIERYLERARHIEVQILGDLHGGVISLGDRECSVQRRHQKIIEESPAPNLNPSLRDRLTDAAVLIGRAVGYVSAGTVEFLVTLSGEFYFLEMNTRIQVEHAVTEQRYGIDLVEQQIQLAMGAAVRPATEPEGHSIEARLYAEDPARDFVPSAGKILRWRSRESSPFARIDSGIEEGMEVTTHYDPLLAKFIFLAPSRDQAIQILRHSLAQTSIHGVLTNRNFLLQVLDHADFRNANVSTAWKLDYQPNRRAEGQAKNILEVYIAERRRRERGILPTIPRGYRNNPFHAAEDPIEVVSCEPRRIAVEIGGERCEFDVSGDAQHYWIGDFVFPRESRFASAGAAATEESASSPMPGKVLRILAEPGREVRAGDPLVILEAMKMEQTVRAHAAGIVEAVLARPGQIVAPGQTLVRIAAKENK